MAKSIVAERLRAAREEAGLTLRELGALAGMSHMAVARAEYSSNPGVETVRRLAEALGVSLASLVEDANA